MEAEEKIKEHSFVRTHYYPGKLLHASDFEGEQEYGNGKREFLNRKLGGCGIVEGLEVRSAPAGRIEVGAGSAIDGQGRIIIVPEKTLWNLEDIADPALLEEKDLVLGIRYAERDLDSERAFLAEGEEYHTAKILEGYSLQTYRISEWRQRKQGLPGGGDLLESSHVLYEDGAVRLTLLVPRLVPSDSLFRMRVTMQNLPGKKIPVGMRCVVSLQGGFFPATGQRNQVLGVKEAVWDGKIHQDWEICTDAGRHFPLVLEVESLEVFSGGSVKGHGEPFQCHIEAKKEYRRSVRELVRGALRSRQGQTGDWIPLAHLKPVKGTEGRYSCNVYDGGLRFYAASLWEEELLHRTMEEGGIREIGWRSRPQPLPEPPQDRGEEEKDGEAQEKELRELFHKLAAEEGAQRVCKGVTVIPIPKRYKRGRVLLSEEISHGFLDGEILLWCGRVCEERNYAYWENKEKKYSVTYGTERLFGESAGGGWVIEDKALRRNVDEGTFQIAVTLARTGKRGRGRDSEIAISWMALKIT